MILVGTEPEHTNNKALLGAANLQALQVASIDQLIELSPSGFCGFVVGSSVWLGLSLEQQRVSLERICGLSSFVFVRIATDGLVGAAADVNSIVSRVRSGPVDGERFCHAPNAELSQADIRAIEKCANLLLAVENTGFFPLGMSEAESTLLRLIANCRSSASGSVLSGKKLGARELFGGRSGAKLYLLKGETGRPVVVKLHSDAMLQDEVTRHQIWISDWEPALTTPTLYRHMGVTAICYRLQSDISGEEPAPTLERAVEKLKADEWDQSCVDIEARRKNLEVSVQYAASRLKELNSMKAPLGSISVPWLHWPALELRQRGIQMASTTLGGVEVDLLDVALEAERRIVGLCAAGIVHGDIHGRNILLIDRCPAFIDYASSGAGNPFEDLARLDAAIRSATMRAVLDEGTLTALYSALYIRGDSVEDILRDYPGVAISHCCRLSIFAAVEARSTALMVAEKHGASLMSYLATVAIVSSYVLATHMPGSMVERACLRSISPEFAISTGSL